MTKDDKNAVAVDLDHKIIPENIAAEAAEVELSIIDVMKLSEKAFSEWDNEVDEIYDLL